MNGQGGAEKGQEPPLGSEGPSGSVLTNHLSKTGLVIPTPERSPIISIQVICLYAAQCLVNAGDAVLGGEVRIWIC